LRHSLTLLLWQVILIIGGHLSFYFVLMLVLGFSLTMVAMQIKCWWFQRRHKQEEWFLNGAIYTVMNAIVIIPLLMFVWFEFGVDYMIAVGLK